MKTETLLVVAGKRKSAVAKVRLIEGNGSVTYNRLGQSALPFFLRVALEEPLAIAREVLGNIKFDFVITTAGGGRESQIEAARLAIAKALVTVTKSAELKKAFLSYDRGLLVADTRRKETYKPGDSKARAKRQKSYR